MARIVEGGAIAEVAARLRRLLSERTPRRIRPAPGDREAAVMVVLRLHEGRFEMLFIKRTAWKSDAFSGHMAFPGGKCAPSDPDKLGTALRETLEETGIDLARCGVVVGSLSDIQPITPEVRHYVVTPYVALLLAPVVVKTNCEVERFYWIPVSHLKLASTHKARAVVRLGVPVVDHVYEYQGETIWGMTGRIVHDFLDLAGHLF